MTIAILVAPATRVGYLLYPIDFFIWAWLLRSEELGTSLPLSAMEAAELDGGAGDQSSVTANMRTVNGVVSDAPPDPEPNVVDATVTPISHS